jgi:hypothetical protein
LDNWPALGWLVERQYSTRFSKPEIQISLNNSFNQTVNALSITISAEEAQEIEAKAELNRAKVRELFSKYRPSQRNGENASGGSRSVLSEA